LRSSALGRLPARPAAMGVCCACSLEGLAEGELQVAENPKPGDAKRKKTKASRASRDKELRSRTPLSPITENQVQERADAVASEDPEELRSACRKLPDTAVEDSPASSETTATPPEGNSPSGATVTPTEGDWAAWTAADACSPTLQVDDDWADWEQAPACPAVEPQQEAAPAPALPPPAVASQGAGVASCPDRAELSWSMMAPATRELSAAAPHKPAVWPRFASIEAWITGLPEPEEAYFAPALKKVPSLEVPEEVPEEVVGIAEEPAVVVSSTARPRAWNMRPSVGTWLAARQTRQKPACSSREMPASCRLAFGFAPPGAPAAQGHAVYGEALCDNRAEESPVDQQFGGPPEQLSAELEKLEVAELTCFEPVVCEVVPDASAPTGSSPLASALDMPPCCEEHLLPLDLFTAGEDVASKAVALDAPTSCELLLSFDVLGTSRVAATEACQPLQAMPQAPPAAVVEPEALQRPWCQLPSVGTWLARRPLRIGAVQEAPSEPPPREEAAQEVPSKPPLPVEVVRKAPPELQPCEAEEAAPLEATPCVDSPLFMVVRDGPCPLAPQEASSFLDQQSDEMFRAAAAVLPKMEPPAPLKPGEWKPSAAKASVVSFDPYAPEDDEPSTTDTEGSERSEECPIS